MQSSLDLLSFSLQLQLEQRTVENVPQALDVCVCLTGAERDSVLLACFGAHGHSSALPGSNVAGKLLILVVNGLLCMAYPSGCRHKLTFPAEAKALPHW